jgi:hypothetical protein
VELASYGDLAVRLVNTEIPDRPEEDALANLADLRALIGEHRTWAGRVTDEDLAGCAPCAGRCARCSNARPPTIPWAPSTSSMCCCRRR